MAPVLELSLRWASSGEARAGAGEGRQLPDSSSCERAALARNLSAVPFAPQAAASLHTLDHRGAEVSFTDQTTLKKVPVPPPPPPTPSQLALPVVCLNCGLN